MANHDQPLSEIDDVVVEYPVANSYRLRRERVRALNGVSCVVRRGKTLGIVGESGSGKSTLGRVALRRVAPLRGRVVFDGKDLTDLRERDLRPYRARIQSIFQDPFNSLNPRLRGLSAVAEPLIAHGGFRSERQAKDRVASLLQTVGLPPEAMYRYPRSFSGGQLQRVSIARALALEPELVVADEPVSSLDVSIQAQILCGRLGAPSSSLHREAD
jgi:ABC-type glutathione transport system ATPase component